MSEASHPFVPDWAGERSWTPPGEPPSDFAIFEAGALGAPFRIEHGRDMIFHGSVLEQDYNFIDYFFGDPAAPIHARHYLGDDEVSVDLPMLPADANLDQARAAFPTEVLLYLQRRFRAVRVLASEGYVELWALSR